MKDFYKQIHGWFDWEDVYSDFAAKLQNGDRVCEVGCWRGKSICFLGQELQRLNKNVLVDCVDSWHDPDGSVEIFKSNISRCGFDFISPHKINSVDGASLFNDGTFQFVLIDADHNFEPVKNDIAAWLPKVAPGGILCGHDYGGDHVGVKLAVDEVFGIGNFRVQGQVWIFKKPL